jgi:hypothetical protein
LSTAGSGELGEWLVELAELGPPPEPPRMPPRQQAAALLRRLAVPEADAEEIAALLPSPAADPDVWWLLERCYHRLTRGLGDDSDFLPSPDGRGPWGRWPALPDDLGAAGRLFYPHLFLAAVPVIRYWHDAQGIDEAVSWATLQDYGRSIEAHRSMHGVTGLDFPAWLILHFRGGLFHLGRLQFRRGTVFWSADDLATGGAPFGPGDRVLDLHIPPTVPLTPDSVDESFAAARVFFARHFPRHDSPWAVCASWLLDPQLAEYLPAASNIIRFQRRFHLVPPHKAGNDPIIKFVFRHAAGPDLDFDELPQHTTLQRAIVTHIRNGGTWNVHRGWCRTTRPT